MKRKRAEIEFGGITVRFEEGFNVMPVLDELKKIISKEKKKRKRIFKRKKGVKRNGKK